MSRVLTKAGIEVIKEKIGTLQRELQEVRKTRAEVYEVGGNGWHDNPAYEAVEEKERMLTREVYNLQQELEKATIVLDDSSNKDSVGLGMTVEVDIGSARKQFTLGDSQTANPARGIISSESPLGMALYGARINETRQYAVGDKTFTVTIKKILE